MTTYLSRRKPLTLAGSASPVAPLPEFVYVRKYVPAVTSKLVQQLSGVPASFMTPQLVRPGPLVWQLGAVPPSVPPELLTTPPSEPNAEPPLEPDPEPKPPLEPLEEEEEEEDEEAVPESPSIGPLVLPFELEQAAKPPTVATTSAVTKDLFKAPPCVGYAASAAYVHVGGSHSPIYRTVPKPL